jgi:hypothetical protein
MSVSLHSLSGTCSSRYFIDTAQKSVLKRVVSDYKWFKRQFARTIHYLIRRESSIELQYLLCNTIILSCVKQQTSFLAFTPMTSNSFRNISITRSIHRRSKTKYDQHWLETAHTCVSQQQKLISKLPIMKILSGDSNHSFK